MDDKTALVLMLTAEHISIPVSKVSLDSTFSELGYDSLDVVDLVLSVEEELNIDISDDDIDTLVTVRDLVNLIK